MKSALTQIFALSFFLSVCATVTLSFVPLFLPRFFLSWFWRIYSTSSTLTFRLFVLFLFFSLPPDENVAVSRPADVLGRWTELTCFPSQSSLLWGKKQGRISLQCGWSSCSETGFEICSFVVGASQRLVPALQPGHGWFVCSLGLVLFLLGSIWIRMMPIEWLRQKESSTKGQRSWIWTRDKPGEEWKEMQGGRPQWNNSPYNRFDILYLPEDSKHCVIIYKWLPPPQQKDSAGLCFSTQLQTE